MTDEPRAGKSPPPTPKRRYAQRPASEIREVDSADLMLRRKTLMWATAVGVLCTPVSLLLAEKVGAEPPISHLFLLGGPAAGFVVYQIVTKLTFGAAAVMGRIHNPSGDSTPAVKEYSRAQALAQQGHYHDAVRVYEDFVTLYPTEPEPYIRIARLLRDHLNEYEEAIRWFKRARTEAQVNMGQELVVSREIIEIYSRKLGEPARAIPELARLVDRFPDHPSVETTRQELDRLRQDVLHRREETIE